MPDFRRLMKDMKELYGIPDIKLEYIDENDLTRFYIYVKVNEGIYSNHYYKFLVEIGENWPIEAPRVRIREPIWHPSIGEYDPNNPDSGKICVAPISFNYVGTLSLAVLVKALKYLLNESNITPNLTRNPTAADEFIRDRNMFYAKAKELADKVRENDPSSNEKKD